MGFGWSSLVAQSTMIYACFEAGFVVDQFLTEERILPDCNLGAISVATDDVLHFQRGTQVEIDAFG